MLCTLLANLIKTKLPIYFSSHLVNVPFWNTRRIKLKDIFFKLDWKTFIQFIVRIEVIKETSFGPCDEMCV